MLHEKLEEDRRRSMDQAIDAKTRIATVIVVGEKSPTVVSPSTTCEVSLSKERFVGDH